MIMIRKYLIKLLIICVLIFHMGICLFDDHVCSVHQKLCVEILEQSLFSGVIYEFFQFVYIYLLIN